MDTSFLTIVIILVLAVAKAPNRSPGTPYDFEILLITIRFKNSSSKSLFKRVLLGYPSAKSTNDSSIMICMFLFWHHRINLMMFFFGMKFPDGLSGLIRQRVVNSLSEKKSIRSFSV